MLSKLCAFVCAKLTLVKLRDIKFKRDGQQVQNEGPIIEISDIVVKCEHISS
jgi:hypothetical protein